MRDAFTVWQKEMKENWGRHTVLMHTLTFALYVGVFGVFLPWGEAQALLDENSLLSIFFLFLPLMVTSGYVADTFAGEKERGTLETLLASRISDRALFAGKALFVFTISYIILLTVFVSALMTLNVWAWRHGARSVFLFGGVGSFAVFVLSAATCVLAIGMGVFASLRAATVRGAQLATNLPYIVLSFPLITGLVRLNMTWAFVTLAFAGLLAASGAAFWLSTRFFRRHRLVAGA